jgi:uncharacterized protein YndB with AHSA1/START domain
MTPVGDAEAELDVRPGGGFRIVMRAEGVTIVHTGEYLEVDPPRRLVFTWISPYTDGPSVVTVDLLPHGDETELVLTHSALPAKIVESHRGGWGAMIARLSGQLEAVSDLRSKRYRERERPDELGDQDAPGFES